MSIEDIRRLKAQAGIPKPKKQYVIPKKSAKKIKQEKALDTSDNAQDEWFKYFMETCEPVCEECGMRADWLKEPKYELIWRACQAHILPKKKTLFPSLATNKNNHLILFPSWGGWLCGCHGFYDSNWYNASTMKIWESVKDVFKTRLYPAIPEMEKKNIPEQLATLV